MTTPNMSSITASLERDLQNFSINHHQNSYSSSGSNNSNGGGGSGGGSGIGTGGGGAAALEENHHDLSNSTSETSYELNSHISLPYHWEQCLDLKTGELYYINWRTGMKAKEDPRTAAAGWSGDFDEDSEDDASSYESEDSSEEESSPSVSRNQCISTISSNNYSNSNSQSNERGSVLVVAGCKSCMMYFMVPKQGEDCPKCSGQLLHFDRSENASSP